MRGGLRNARNVVRTILRDPSNRGERTKRLLAGAAFQIWKRTVARPITIQLCNGMRFRAYPDCYSSSLAVYARIPFARQITFLRSRLHGGTFIDVGANVGLVTLLLADRIDHALLFEPNPVAMRRARQNLDLNGLGFETLEIAISDREGEITFEDRGGVATQNRVVSDSKSTGFPTRNVPCRKLDRVLDEHGGVHELAALKIDVEDHEEAVIRGMVDTLSRLRPPLIMFEYLRTNLTALSGLLASAGYRVCGLAADGRLVNADAAPRPPHDLFAVPVEGGL